MDWVRILSVFYYRVFYWPFMALTVFGGVIVVGVFIAEPRFTLATLQEFLLVIAALIYSVSYTRERRMYLRGMNPITSGQPPPAGPPAGGTLRNSGS